MLANFFAGLIGFRRLLVAAALGTVATFALPPFYLVPLLVPAFVGWVLLLAHTQSRKHAFFLSWWFGIGHCAAGYYWISHSLLVDAAKHGWLVPIAVIGFAAVLGLFPAMAGLVAVSLRRLKDHPSGTGILPLVFILASAWVGMEWIRSWIFTGFPWNLIGTVWAFLPAMLQPAAIGGVYLLSLGTILAATLPAVWFERAAAPKSRRLFVSLSGLLLLAVAGIWGHVRLSEEPPPDHDGIVLRLIQPNIAQADKWKRDLRVRHVTRQINMSVEPPGPGQPAPTHIIWAETAAPYVMTATPGLVAAVAQAAPVGGLVLTGALRRESSALAGRPAQVWNSLHAIDSKGNVVATYDKSHLVPFGEYVPFEEALGFLKITVGRGNFSAGPGLKTLNLEGLPPVVPLICYEAIFPGSVIPEGERPLWLLNITNDAWFGLSVGPHQHYAAAKLRAVEEGLPLVRAANTGISAIIDAYGRERSRLPLGAEGVLDAPLPGALPLTVYGRTGNGPILCILLLMMVGFAVFSPNSSTRVN